MQRAVSGVCAIVTPSCETFATHKPTPTHTLSPANVPCSRNGYCGSTPSYCDPGNCLSAWGPCAGTVSASIAPSPSPLPKTECGYNAYDPNKAACTLSRCCSRAGFCGATADFCDVDRGCQIGYG